MINYETEMVEVESRTIKSVICDECGQEFTDILDIQEFHFIQFIGGFASIFGDGNKVESQICQDCLYDLLGGALRVLNSDGTWIYAVDGLLDEEEI